MILISIHIFKTAGTTFYSIIDRIFKRNEILNVNIEGVSFCEEAIKNGILENKKSIKIIHGHFPLGWHEYLSGKTRYISFLRIPQQRVLSDYFYNKEFSKGHNYSYASTMTLIEYLNCDKILDMDNGQTRYISGDLDTPYGRCNHEMLVTAKSNIDSMFLFVGLTERFDESLILLNHYLGWKKIYYSNKNVTKNKMMALTPLEVQTIKERNRLDEELYQYVSEQFEKRIQEVFLFKLRLVFFNFFNLLYKTIHPVYKLLSELTSVTLNIKHKASMRIFNKVKVLSQLSFKEGVLLIAGFIISRINGKAPSFISQDIFVMCDQMSYIIEKGNELQKVHNTNIATFKNPLSYKGLILCLRRMTTDYNIYGQIFRFEEYKPLVDIVNTLKTKEILYIVDAGANVGCSTVYFKTIFPKAKNCSY